MAKDKAVGVIGGSGLYQMEGLEVVDEVPVETPFGAPSDHYIVGTFHGQKLIFLPRHGRGHGINPSEINYRANIYGMKKLGVEIMVGVSAVGSLREKIVPGHVVVIDQFIDRTKGRPSTFFDKGVTAHIPFADPLCPSLRPLLIQAAKKAGAKVHEKGTYLCMEGPQFSTRAESNLYRQWGADVIGMTNLQEAKLAREAEICYATLALSTDYDCWHDSEEDVTIEAVLETLNKNVNLAKETIKNLVDQLGKRPLCPCQKTLQNAIITDRQKITPEIRKRLQVIAGKYL